MAKSPSVSLWCLWSLEPSVMPVTRPVGEAETREERAGSGNKAIQFKTVQVHVGSVHRQIKVEVKDLTEHL